MKSFLLFSFIHALAKKMKDVLLRHYKDALLPFTQWKNNPFRKKILSNNLFMQNLLQDGRISSLIPMARL